MEKKAAYLTEAARQVPVCGDYDVAVVGGGIAGIAAALAAARHGARTVLIEKQFAVGGLATLGLVTAYLPLCDGKGRQVSFGIAEELLRLSVEKGAEGRCPDAWLSNGSAEAREKMRYMSDFNASMFALLCERLLLREGVTLLYGTSVCAVETASDAAGGEKKVTALFLENKSGRSALRAKSFVDASGDADVFALAGAPTVNFAQENILAAWYYAVENGKFTLHPLGAADIPDKEKKSGENGPKLLTDRRFSGLDGKELSEMTVLSHEKIFSHFLSNGTISPQHMLASIASIPQVRMTRRPAGRFTLDDTDDHRHFDDSIGMISDWRKAGPVFEVPFGCLVGALKNVAAAGRCISVTDAMWDISRVIPCCAVTGQAAGTAAALSDDFEMMTKNVESLQHALQNDGVVLHL